MATVVTPGQQCLGAKCESGSLWGAEAITSCPNVMAALTLSTLRSGLIFKRRWTTFWQACRAQRPITTNRRAWDRWTHDICGRPKESGDLDDTIWRSVGETGTR